MKLLTKRVEKILRGNPLHSHEKEGLDAPVAVKYFLPAGTVTCLITEGEQLADGDWRLFGYLCMFPGEWTWDYVLLSELQSIRTPRLGLGFERDMYLAAGTTVRKAASIFGDFDAA